jgi:Putative regulator of cell autolysis
MVILLLLSGCSPQIIHNEVEINNGLLDLRGHSIDDYNTFRLDGTWKFYWKRLIGYQELSRIKPDLYGRVPLCWNKYILNGRHLSDTGYASYSLHVITDLPTGTMLGFQIDTFSSAFEMYINDKKVASAGKVSANPQEEIGRYKPLVTVFEIPAREFDIIVHVSNYEYARGGFWASTYMGRAEDIMTLHDVLLGKEIFLAGIFLVSALFYFAIFLANRELKFLLYFACFCLVKILEIDTIGQFILFHLFPGLDFQYYVLIWYSAILWAILFLILYMGELYRSRFADIVTKIFFAAFVFYQLYILVHKPLIYSEYVYFCDIISVIGALIMVVIIAMSFSKNGGESWLNMLSMFIMFATYTHDYLYWANIIKDRGGEWFYIGFTIFLLLQILIQKKRFNAYNEHLTATELAFLQAQIKPHFLFNAINTFISISYYDVEAARELLVKFSDYLRKSFEFKRINQCAPLSHEIELAKVYTEIEKARFEERLEVNFDVSADLAVQVPVLVLQPVIENAIIHGILPKEDGGKIHVLIRQEGKWLIFKVRDNGVGMDVRAGNIRKEDRVGLSNIDNRLKKLYHKGIHIESSKGAGCEVTWFVRNNQGGVKK